MRLGRDEILDLGLSNGRGVEAVGILRVVLSISLCWLFV